MRWTDLPADDGPADAGASALSRGEWDDLRRRLERLPPGHPSHPDGESRTDEAADDEALADEGTNRPGPSETSGPDPEGSGQAVPIQARGRRAEDHGSASPGAHGDLAGPGGREPYRPWFTGSESPEPWFAADPD